MEERAWTVLVYIYRVAMPLFYFIILFYYFILFISFHLVSFFQSSFIVRLRAGHVHAAGRAAARGSAPSGQTDNA